MTSDTIRQIFDELIADSNNQARLYYLERILDSAKDIRTQNDADRQLKQLQLTDSNDNIISSPCPPPPPPPPPPPSMMKLKLAPPPPPPPPLSSGAPPPPPPPMTIPMKMPMAPISQQQKLSKIKEVCPSSMAPKKEKKTKTKSVQWSKIKSVEENSVWAKLARSEQGIDLNFDLLDNFFGIECAKNDVQPEKKKLGRKDAQIELLTSKRSQNIAIMLKQFKNIDEFLENLRMNKPVAENDAISNLFSILPAEDEEEALKRYSGDTSLLSPPSSFFYRLVQIPHYRLRLETLIFLSDFSRLMQEFGPNIDTLTQASEEILKSPSVPKILLILINMGNYLNLNNSQGNASGFTLNSMWKLIDLKGNRQEFSLLHLLVTHDSNLVGDLENELSTVKEASQISFEEIKNSLRTLKLNRSKLESQLEKRSQDEEFEQFLEIVKIDCNFELKEFEKQYENLVEKQKSLAKYFCENAQIFQLDECIKIFSFLLIRLHQAHKEHVLRELRKARKQQKGEGEEEGVPMRNEQKSPISGGDKKENVNLFDTLANSTANSDVTRKRASDISDIRQKLGNIRVRKIRDICQQIATTAEIIEEVKPSQKEVTTKTSPNYESCNDLESYISNLTKKRTSILQKQQVKEIVPEKCLNISVIPEVTPEPVKPVEPKASLMKKPTKITSPTVRIVSVTPQKEPLPKMAELRRPKIVERKITPPMTTPKIPVVKVTPRVTIIAPTTVSINNKPLANRRASAPAMRKPVVDVKKKEITVKPTVSTSARPSLINTCSSPTSRSSLPKLSVLEKPKPLRTTPSKITPASTPSPTPIKSALRQPSRPKWV